MSTKVTKAYGDNFHIYTECFEMEDEDPAIAGRLWIEIDKPDFYARPTRLAVALPVEAVRGLRDVLWEDRSLSTEAQLKHIQLCALLIQYREAIEEAREEDVERIRERMFTHVY